MVKLLVFIKSLEAIMQKNRLDWTNPKIVFQVLIQLVIEADQRNIFEVQTYFAIHTYLKQIDNYQFFRCRTESMQVQPLVG